jgi:hypothetical protein
MAKSLSPHVQKRFRRAVLAAATVTALATVLVAPAAAAPPVTGAVAAVAPVRTTLLTAPAIKKEMESATTRAAEMSAVVPVRFRSAWLWEVGRMCTSVRHEHQ